MLMISADQQPPRFKGVVDLGPQFEEIDFAGNAERH
jgi:hypothetical protein